MCRKTVAPHWDEEFRFEVADDSELQNEPIEFKVHLRESSLIMTTHSRVSFHCDWCWWRGLRYWDNFLRPYVCHAILESSKSQLPSAPTVI